MLLDFGDRTRIFFFFFFVPRKYKISGRPQIKSALSKFSYLNFYLSLYIVVLFLESFRLQPCGELKKKWNLNWMGFFMKNEMPTARGVPRWSPSQVLTAPDAAWLRWSDENRYFQHGMAVGKIAVCNVDILSELKNFIVPKEYVIYRYIQHGMEILR